MSTSLMRTPMARAMARNSGLANLVSCRAPAAFALARRLQSTTTTQNFDGVAGENRSISRKQYEKWSRKHAEIMHIIDRQLEELNQSRDPITREYIREPHILMSGKKDYQEFVEAQEAERVAHPVQAALRELKEQQAQNAEVVADMTAKLHEMERQGQVKNSSQGPSNTARPTTAKTEPSVSRAPGDREKPKPSKLDRYEWMFTWTYTLVMLCFMYISWPESWTIERKMKKWRKETPWEDQMHQLGAAMAEEDEYGYKRALKKVAQTEPNRSYEVFAAMLKEHDTHSYRYKQAAKKMLDGKIGKSEAGPQKCKCNGRTLARWISW